MDFSTLMMLLAIAFGIYGFWLFFSHEETTSTTGFKGHIITRAADPAKKNVALGTIAHIWTKKADLHLQLKELAQLWKEMPVEVAAEAERPVSFSRPEIDAFYEQRLKNKPYFSGNVRRAALKLLELLDRFGDCPSVVQGPGEVESQMGKSAYDALVAIPLWEHSLNVANEMLARVGDGPLVPKAIMAALGHDIGKIPAFRDKLYATGDHALMSVMVLNDVDGYKFIPYAEEVSNAIKSHHKTVAKEKRAYLDDKLKEADQAARRNEMAQKTTSAVLDNTAGGGQELPVKIAVSKSPIASILSELPTSIPQQQPTPPSAPISAPTGAVPALPAVTGDNAPAEVVIAPETTPEAAPRTAAVLPGPKPAGKTSNAAVFDQIIGQARAETVKPENSAPGNGEQSAKTQNSEGAVKKDPFAKQRQAAGLAPVAGTMPMAEPAQQTAKPAAPQSREEEPADFFGNKGDDEKAKIRPQTTAVEWFVYEDFVEEAKAYINKMFGNRWFAFSMRTGVVYIQTTTVMDIIRKIGRKRQIADIEIAETDEELRKNILFSVFTTLRRDHGAIYDGLVRDGFFSAFFTVRMRDGREYKKCSYIPFNYEVFCTSVATMEQDKHGKLLEIVEVVPFSGD